MPTVPDEAVRERRTTDFIRFVVSRYPGRTALLVGILVLSGITESIGIMALLPLLEVATGGLSQEQTAISRTIESLLTELGVPVRLEAMLALITAAMVLKGAFRLLAMKQIGYTVSRVGNDLRLEYIDSLLRTGWGHFVQQPAGRFATAIGAETMRASLSYRHICSLFAVTIQIVIYAGVSFLVSWKIALVALAAGLLLLIVRAPLVRQATAASKAQNVLVKSLSVQLTDALGSIKPIKAMGGEQFLGPLFHKEVAVLNDAQERQVLATETVVATREPLVVLMLCVVLYAVLSSSPQSFASILVVAFLFTRLAGQIGQAQVHYQDAAHGEAAFWSVRESIELANSRREPFTGGLTPPPLKEGIELDGVSFDYGGEPVLDRVSLRIPAGQFVALIGPSGSGKTSLGDLLVRLYSPVAGTILVDGIPLKNLDLTAWREQVGYVPQDAFLFHDTLFRNIVMGNPNLTRADVSAALEAAGGREFLEQLPQGLDTMLGERGARLSGGQRQRVAIARAVVRKPRLLILDEVTSALDPDTEAGICETLRNLRGQVTIFAISHQPAIMEAADIVYRIERGRVKHAGIVNGLRA